MTPVSPTEKTLDLAGNHQTATAGNEYPLLDTVWIEGSHGTSDHAVKAFGHMYIR